MSFTIVIPFWNGHQYLDKLLSTIPESLPVIIVNDLSESPLPSIDRPGTRVIDRTGKGYFTGATNTGIRACDTDVLILNQDTFFTNDDWIRFIEENKQEFALFGERAGSHPAWHNRYVHGTFMYVRRDLIDAIGLMDEKNYPHWGSTCEYQLRACRKGFKVNPVKKGEVPGFVHKRRGPYGTATQQALLNAQRGLLIRTPPFISVIITCYNYGRFLPDAINSLVGGPTSLGKMPGQTFQSFEIIIVDDGSTDNSAKIAKGLADPWSGIHFVHQRNKGSAAAMNTGIAASHARHGGLIAPLDGDDMMEPQRLERMLRTYEANPHSVIYDNLQYFGNGERGVVVDWQTGKKMNRLNLKGYDFEKMLDKNAGFGMHKGLLYPKRAWEEASGYPEIMTRGREDWAFNIGLGIKGWCGVNTGAFDYLYRRELQGRSLTNTSPTHHQQFLEQLKSTFPNIYAGERPMGCCGSGSARASNGRGGAAMAARNKNLPGQEGMVILEYVGGNAGDETWVGPITKTIYVLGGVRQKGYVDKRDAHGDPSKRIKGMLAFRDRKRPVFVEAKAAVEAPSIELMAVGAMPGVEKEEPEPLKWKQGVVQNVIEPPLASLLPDMSTLSVAKIKELLPDLAIIELETVLKSERSGKNRSTAIAAIEATMNERLA